MAERDDIVKFLNKELNVKKIRDSSKNGLQVKGNHEIKKIGFAVDACLETFEKAKKEGCDMVIVHHGIYWKKSYSSDKITNKRADYLRKNNISLYASHLPLDLHNKYGNNIELCRILGLKNVKKFGKYHGVPIGYQGRFDKPVNIISISKSLDKKLNTKSVISAKKVMIRSVGVISGGGISCLEEAEYKKLDCFITGEEYHSSFHDIKESKISVILSGHYATETLGVKALIPLLKEKFNVNTVFIDAPTKL